MLHGNISNTLHKTKHNMLNLANVLMHFCCRLKSRSRNTTFLRGSCKKEAILMLKGRQLLLQSTSFYCKHTFTTGVLILNVELTENTN